MSGAEVTEVLGSGFASVRELVRDEDRIIQQLADRSPSNRLESRVGGDSRGPYRYNGTPLIITTESMAATGRYVLFWSGPSNTQWSFPLRAAQQQTRSGTILHLWKNGSRDTFFDEPQVTFTFQSGNIMPVRIRQGVDFNGTSLVADTVSLPPGLLDFYDFFDILNEPKILSDGRPNFVYISYHSLVYPEIFLRGFFMPEGLSFSEDAQNPGQVSWTSTFKIRTTEPPFWSGAQLKQSWLSALRPGFQETSDSGGEVGGDTLLGTTNIPVPGQGEGG